MANTPQAISNWASKGLSEYIKTIGLYNSKAKNVIETCRMLVELHNGEVPQTREALEALPGVGRKTANVVLNTAFRQPTMAVDTHIFRVAIARVSRPAKTSSKWKTTDEVRSQGVPARCSPLADPAWPLCVPGAQATLRQLPDRRPVRI